MAPDRGHNEEREPLAATFETEERESGENAIPNQVDSKNTTASRIAKREAAAKLLAARAADPTNFTLRGVLAGLVIGIVICFSNVYFGLQTGWISGMSMPSALIAFAFFRSISRFLKVPFSPVENVLVQSVAGSVGTMPLGCGFVGVIPAMEYLLKPEENGPLDLGYLKSAVWAVGICLFGVVFAVPLRRQVILREKLKFPSGSATALIIALLHGGSSQSTLIKQQQQHSTESSQSTERDAQAPAVNVHETSHIEPPDSADQFSEQENNLNWRGKIKLLIFAFAGSATYTVFTYFVPQVRNLPILGLYLARNYLWTFNPSPAYVGQGIIMGPATTIHMLIGAIIGWGILSPLAKERGWAPGPISDWETGSKGWIVWVSLAIMLADAVVSLGWLTLEPLILYGKRYLPELLHHVQRHEWRQLMKKLTPLPDYSYSPLNPSEGAHTPLSEMTPRQSNSSYIAEGSETVDEEDEPELDAPSNHLITQKALFFWAIVSLALYFASVHVTFPRVMKFAYSLLGLLLALLLSIMGVRAIGSTDLNPVSGISKLTQLFFSLFVPSSNKNAVLINLVAGAISESGALQAGDLMQDLKTGHLLGASPKAQFHGQVIASVFGAVLSAAVYRLYTKVYTIPNETFQVPTAYVWIFTARLVTGSGLPPKAAESAAISAAIFVLITIARTYAQIKRRKLLPFIPGGIAVAVGMYNTPSFTLARVLGGLISGYWVRVKGRGEEGVVVLASGLILGEGLLSILNLCLESLKVPHF